MQQVKVQVYRAVLTVEGETIRLTKSIAKQFPFDDPRRKRYSNIVSGRPLREPIGKVMGSVLGIDEFSWLYLVPDEKSGMAWAFPVCPHPQLAADMRAKGQHVDDPTTVPTLVL